MYILVKAEQFTVQTLISLHPKEDTRSLTQDQIQAFIKRKKKPKLQIPIFPMNTICNMLRNDKVLKRECDQKSFFLLVTHLTMSVHPPCLGHY